MGVGGVLIAEAAGSLLQSLGGSPPSPGVAGEENRPRVEAMGPENTDSSSLWAGEGKSGNAKALGPRLLVS